MLSRRSAVTDRLGDERGFTLVELVVTMAIGTVVMLAAGSLLDASTRASADVEDRAEAIDRGRRAMEDIVSRLRAQSCLDDATPALVRAERAGSGASVRETVDFYSVFGPAVPQVTIYGNDDLTLDQAQARRVEYLPAGVSSTIPGLTPSTVPKSVEPVARIVEGVWRSPLSRPDPSATFTARPPDETREIVSGVAPVGATPIFSYFQFQNDDPGTPDLPVNPAPLLSAEARARVVRMEVAFDARPTRRAKTASQRASIDSSLVNEVFVRTADAGQPKTSPECF